MNQAKEFDRITIVEVYHKSLTTMLPPMEVQGSHITQCVQDHSGKAWTIHRNLDTTRQDVQKAVVAAFRIAGFW